MARKKRRGRPVNGILVLDKPAGLSSNQALQQVRFLYFAAKAGHTGSLDPLATGVLPVCFGEATKFSQYLLDADKSYHTTIVLGAESDTEDADGKLRFVGDTAGLSRQQLLQVVASLAGEQMQVPPMYSALKHQGQRLYDLARQGQEVEREARKIVVRDIEVTAFRPHQPYVGATFADPAQPLAAAVSCEVELTMTVSKGTYVRSLAAEIGRQLGVGGYVKELRRTQAGVFDISQAVAMEQLEALKARQAFAEMDAWLEPVEKALAHIPDVVLDDNTGFYLRRGNPVQVPRAPANGVVKLMLETGEFVGIGEIDDSGLVAPKRLVVSQQ